MSDLVEFYLTGIWSYRQAGVDRIIEELKSLSIPNAEYTFDTTSNWFKVACHEDDVQSVQVKFKDAQVNIEFDIDVNEVTQPDGTVQDQLAENEWIKAVDEHLLPSDSVQQQLDYQCPGAFDKYPSTAVWTRIDQDAIPNMTIDYFLSEEDIIDLSKASGTYISYSMSGRVVYVGSHSQQNVDKAVRKLDTLFKYIDHKPSRPKHLLYAEADKSFYVDARFMTHINPNLVTSTIFDPTPYTYIDLAARYQELYANGISLRICVYDPYKKMIKSFFGPKSQPVFQDDGRRWFGPFSQFKYPTKQRISSSEALLPPPAIQAPGEISKKDQVESWMAGVVDAGSTSGPGGISVSQTFSPPLDQMETDKVQDRRRKIALLETELNEERRQLAEEEAQLLPKPAPMAPHGQHVQSSSIMLKADSTSPTNTGMPRSDENSGKQQTPKWQSSVGNNSSTGRTSTLPLPQISSAEPLASNEVVKTSMLGFHPSTITFNMEPLTPGVQADDEASSRKFHSTMRQQTPSRCQVRDGSEISINNHGDSDSDFVRELSDNMIRMAAGLQIKVGKLNLRADLGRICIMDHMPGGLSFNTINEVANGWHPEGLTERLDTGCAPESVEFTKIISIFGNDADYLACLQDDHGNQMWNPHARRVLYDFTCTRKFVDALGNPSGCDRIIVEVDGSEANNFGYTIHSPREETNPIWVHCVHRHWDIRFVMTHNTTGRLEEAYGPFVQALLDSLVVLPGTAPQPRVEVENDTRIRQERGRRFFTEIDAVRVRHVARYLSADRKSFLDMALIRDMDLTIDLAREGSYISRIRARGANDIAEKGKFSGWYEASISPANAREIFRENETMTFGDEASWTGQTLRDAGLFAAVYLPAFKMVEKMDGVGVKVDNGQKEKCPTPPRDVGVVEEDWEANNQIFW